MIELEKCQKQMLLVTIYAPNENQSEYYSKLHEKKLEIGQRNICIVEDYNAVVDIKKTILATQKNKKKRKTLPTSFFDIIQELNLLDRCRRLNPEKKEYTFYSNPHKSWSQLDIIWMNVEIGNELETIEIMTNVWADNNTLMIIWKTRKKTRRR
uniref:Uncharacterized protein n=1 Tax=Micrurus lemniscatus lemniscatus TaxID=129467 RepID=A0A2D4J9C2_MICLE